MRALRRLAVLGLAVLFCVVTIATRAQEVPGCPDLVARALALTSDRCLDLGRDEVCYGNIKLSLVPREGIDQAGIQFEQPGDRVQLASVSSLTLGPLDQSSDEWGVAYMRMRANLPDVAGGQFVTMLMFGDTEIRDASEELARTSGKEYSPMQAFYFRTGVGGGQSGILDACRGLPTNGVLIQTPKGAGEVQLVANEVNLTLGSTVLLEAPGEPETLGNLQTPTGFEAENFDPPEMTITTFEGQAQVEALGQTQIAGPGQQVTVPLDQDSRPFGPPEAPQYTDPDQYIGLTNLITGAGEENLIDLRDADPTATLSPSATPTPTAIPPTRVPATATPTATLAPTVPPPPAPTAVPTTIFAVTGNGQSVPAGGTSGQLGAKVVDANGNPVGYVTVHFEITVYEGPSAYFTGTGGQTEDVITQADGIAYSSPLQVDNYTGIIDISANETYFGFATTFTINVVPGPPASVSMLFGDGQAAPVDTAFIDPLAVLVTDSFGNGVPGIVVNFSAPGSGPSGTFAGSGTNTISAVTDAGGAAITPAFTANTEAGMYSVTATVPGVGGTTFTLVNLAGTPQAINPESGSGQVAMVGTGYAASLRASVRDAYGNLASGAAVTFAAPGGGPSATFSGSGSGSITVAADAFGIADSGGLAAGAVAGSINITVTSGAAPAAFFFLSSVPGPAASLSALSGTGQSTMVTAGFAASLRVSVRDAYGNAVPGAAVTFTAPSGGPSANFSGSGSTSITVLSDASGAADSGALTANTAAGSYNITASAGAAPAIVFSLANTPGPVAALNISGGDGQGAGIGTAFGAPLVVIVRDAYGNAVSGAGVTFSAPGAGASAVFSGSGTSTISTTSSASGQASSGALSANVVQGTYLVTATSGPAAGNFTLTNQPPPPIVTNLNDSGPGSLRFVVANVPAGSAISFSVTGTITLTSGEILVNKDLIFDGPGAGALTVSGNNASGIFHVTGGTVHMESLTLTNGSATVGGAVFLESGALSMVAVTVSNNRALGGGGVYTTNGAPLTVRRSSFIGNVAQTDAGGGIQTNGPATIENCTFSGNSAAGGGGGISARIGLATITNSTFANNSASFGGGVEAQNPQGGAVTLINSIVASNAPNNCNGSIGDGGGNLQFGDSTCGGFANANPNLGGLTGNPAYLPLNAPSPAENLGTANCPAGDARGQVRGTPCDAGAFELP